MSTVQAGFPPEGFRFLEELGANNTKEWFEANKDRYMEQVRTPALALVESIGAGLQEHFPEIRVDTRTNGAGSLMRINRDTRFSKDKTPYKTSIAMMWWQGAGKKTQHPAFGLQITPEDTGLMCGMFTFAKDALNRYRDAVSDEKQGQALLEAVQQVQAAGGYTLEGLHYKRPPRGYDAPSDGREPLLRHNALWVSVSNIPQETVSSAEFVPLCVQHFRTMSPIFEWLRAAGM